MVTLSKWLESVLESILRNVGVAVQLVGGAMSLLLLVSRYFCGNLLEIGMDVFLRAH